MKYRNNNFSSYNNLIYHIINEKIKLLLYIFYIKFIFNNIIVDQTLESDILESTLENDTLPCIEDLRKTSRKRKINECAENECNSNKGCVKKKKRFSKYFNIAATINKIISKNYIIFLLTLKLLSLISDNMFINIYVYNYLFLAPPYGKTKRIRWTEEEIKTALFLFKNYINNSTLPSFKEIIFKTRNNVLKNRQPATIKSWLHNQIRGAKCNKC